MRGVEVNSVLWDAPSGTSYAASVEDYRLLENLNKMATESYSKMTAEAVVLNGNMQQLQAKCAAHAKRDCQWSRRCFRLQYSGSHVFRFSFADSEMAPFLTQIDQAPPRTRRPCVRARAHRPLAQCAHACMQRLCPGVHLHCEPCLPLISSDVSKFKQTACPVAGQVASCVDELETMANALDEYTKRLGAVACMGMKCGSLAPSLRPPLATFLLPALAPSRFLARSLACSLGMLAPALPRQSALELTSARNTHVKLHDGARVTRSLVAVRRNEVEESVNRTGRKGTQLLLCQTLSETGGKECVGFAHSGLCTASLWPELASNTQCWTHSLRC